MKKMNRNNFKQQVKHSFDSIEVDKSVAFQILSDFSAEVVTLKKQDRLSSMHTWFTNLYKFIFSSNMDGKGILTAVKMLGFIFVLALITVILSSTPSGRKLLNDNIAKVVVTPQATATPTVVVADASVDAIIQQIDETAADIDALQKELDALDASLSMTDLDSLTADLNKIN